MKKITPREFWLGFCRNMLIVGGIVAVALTALLIYGEFFMDTMRD